jgi:rhodanese-related sulfurtransferase
MSEELEHDTDKSAGNFRRLSAGDTWDLILELGEERPESLVVLDVRNEKAFAESHLDGARHLSDANVSELLARTPKSSTIVVYCYHGHSSQDIAALFGAFRFAEVYSVDGGFEALAREHAARKSAAEARLEPELPRPKQRYIVGDCVYAREPIDNDGGMPDVDPGARVAGAGTRGIVVQVGHPEADPRQTVYAVRFENATGELGPMVGCLPDELTQEAPSP